MLIEHLFKAGADPNETSEENETALMTASLTGKVDAVKMLLTHGGLSKLFSQRSRYANFRKRLLSPDGPPFGAALTSFSPMLETEMWPRIGFLRALFLVVRDFSVELGHYPFPSFLDTTDRRSIL
jgi:ankyrin repeat protein